MDPTEASPMPPARLSGRQRFSLYHGEETGEDLKQWLAPYADQCTGRTDVLDIGCGPGYFLELLRERNVPGLGIDFDPAMVALCHEKGLSAEIADARTLAGWPERFDAIHAGHIIEHMDGETAIAFLEQCTASLKPGGLLIVRTPNWENDTVRHGGFWMDHTHVRPYPLPLLNQIFVDLGFTVRGAGAEPRGWNDLFIIGLKTPATPSVSLHIPGLSAYNLLLTAEAGTAWPEALRTYYTNFGPEEDICLVVYPVPEMGVAETDVADVFAALGLDPESGPNVVIVPGPIDDDDAPGLAGLLQGRLLTGESAAPWRQQPLPLVVPTAEAMRSAFSQNA